VSAYLSIGAIYRDESAYLREWIEFHRLVGVERFFLYNNFSVDDHREVLAPYVDASTVVIHDWPVFPGQVPAYNDVIRQHGSESRWIAFIDIDEFLFSPTGRPLPEVLAEYEYAPAVMANWAIYGTSGHTTKPPSLVTESYLYRSDDEEGKRMAKSIVDPSRVERCGGAHFFFYKEGSAVDEQGTPVPYSRTGQATWEKLRVNHYFTRSLEEARRKLSRRRPTTGAIRKAALRRLEETDKTLNVVRDEALAGYVPELRRRLAEPVQPESSN
jgi:Glycosyltransferase family 92